MSRAVCLAPGEDSANRHPRRPYERMNAVRHRDSEAGRTVAIQGRKLCAEIAHQKGRDRPLSAAIGII